MLQEDSFFVYSWHIDEKETETTVIRAYGLNRKNENVCIIINDFTPYVYMELPPEIKWTNVKAQYVGDKIDALTKDQKPLKKQLVYRKKLYYAYLDKDKNRAEFPYLFMAFSNKKDINNLVYNTKKGMSVLNVGYMKVKIHENDASPVLQLLCSRDIPSAGWIKFRGRKIKENDKETH